MTEFYIVLGLFWFFGWCSQVAHMQKIFQNNIDEFPDDQKRPAVRFVVAIALIVIWPFIYFYWK